MLLTLGAVAVLLSWLAIGVFGPDPAPESPPASATRTAISPAISDEPPPKPELRQAPDAPPSPVNEVIPDVPQSALDTIWGTVRVSIRVTIDKQGTVVEAVADDPGPSRYFERLSLEASKKWTFTPATSEAPQFMLVKFHFTRDGATAHASPAQ